MSLEKRFIFLEEQKFAECRPHVYDEGFNKTKYDKNSFKQLCTILFIQTCLNLEPIYHYFINQNQHEVDQRSMVK